MAPQTKKVSIGGLRQADPVTLAVLTQDVLRLPIGQIEPATLADLLALSEDPDQLSVALGRELTRFRDQMLREIEDLLDGSQLTEFTNDVGQLAPELVPACLRTKLSSLAAERSQPDTLAAIEAATTGWADVEPRAVALPKPAPPAAKATKKPATTQGTHRVVKPKTRPKKRSTRKSASAVDERREEWIREDVMSRLVNYGNRGLKQSIVVAGSRHRSPWKDLTESEVLAILRKMKRENLVRHSAGRWMVQN